MSDLTAKEFEQKIGVMPPLNYFNDRFVSTGEAVFAGFVGRSTLFPIEHASISNTICLWFPYSCPQEERSGPVLVLQNTYDGLLGTAISGDSGGPIKILHGNIVDQFN